MCHYFMQTYPLVSLHWQRDSLCYGQDHFGWSGTFQLTVELVEHEENHAGRRRPTETVTAVPEIASEKGFWICREGAEEPLFSSVPLPVSLKALSLEVWIEGPREEAERIQTVLKRFSAFGGEHPSGL